MHPLAGMTGGWASYSWPPAICLTAVIVIFSMDLAAERYVEAKYGMAHGHVDVEGLVTLGTEGADAHRLDHQFLHNFDQMSDMERHISRRMSTQRQLGPVYAADVLASSKSKECDEAASTSSDVAAAANADPEAQRRKHAEAAVSEKVLERAEERSFQTQIAAFLILEFGVIFHSVIIGLNLGTAGQEFATLYPVLVFHQSFEGLGIGARMSAIPFPRRLRLMPWFLCAGYGLTTPIAIGIGLGLKSTYNGNSYVAFVISGVLDSISAGILIYTGTWSSPHPTLSLRKASCPVLTAFLPPSRPRRASGPRFPLRPGPHKGQQAPHLHDDLRPLRRRHHGPAGQVGMSCFSTRNKTGVPVAPPARLAFRSPRSGGRATGALHTVTAPRCKARHL